MFSNNDISALWLTFQAASLATVLLLLLGTLLAWWLARTESRWKGICNALIALPLVLPPTCLGFIFWRCSVPTGRSAA